MCKVKEPAFYTVGTSFKCLASNAQPGSRDTAGSSPAGIKACDRNEESGSLFYPVSSFNLQYTS